ncbi:hypothetical protein J2S68_003267 [Glycomyces algeriensis]|uniref:Uncharacterized protein n=1 Tax=Glycomyces algeriensis TaxID=256037 RepID=A0A9W6GAL0_9ACTN|nr:hypothetical protein [Glycomyces algeriensis]GLI44450.1 hypothetical protein GALLR39Z86_43000 [Glycomyces algeriensis]
MKPPAGGERSGPETVSDPSAIIESGAPANARFAGTRREPPNSPKRIARLSYPRGIMKNGGGREHEPLSQGLRPRGAPVNTAAARPPLQGS